MRDHANNGKRDIMKHSKTTKNDRITYKECQFDTCTVCNSDQRNRCREIRDENANDKTIQSPARIRILHELGFHPRKRKKNETSNFWVNDYPSAPNGKIEIYESYDLSTIVNTIFESGRAAGQIQMAQKVESIINNYVEKS
jgi:hypothetical protein